MQEIKFNLLGWESIAWYFPSCTWFDGLQKCWTLETKVSERARGRTCSGNCPNIFGYGFEKSILRFNEDSRKILIKHYLVRIFIS